MASTPDRRPLPQRVAGAVDKNTVMLQALSWVTHTTAINKYYVVVNKYRHKSDNDVASITSTHEHGERKSITTASTDNGLRVGF